uniref:Uncharacterized protein n=1 Tax=Brassica oleracea TaxID=3712 RepID=A0A3P6DTE6_BRAOL|nr:unnamed protein product [Brassica oleracea]
MISSERTTSSLPLKSSPILVLSPIPCLRTMLCLVHCLVW